MEERIFKEQSIKNEAEAKRRGKNRLKRDQDFKVGHRRFLAPKRHASRILITGVSSNITLILSLT